ncbi:MAG: 23S rRNA (pseudouridine(1915)-N(3))-methyltransferase RlmH [Pseudomonadota bacterium]
MQITILTVGKTKTPFFQDGEREYFARIKHYTRLQIKSVRSEKIKSGVSDEIVLKGEGEKILKQILPQSYVVALDLTGKQLSSEELAAEIQGWQNSSVREVVFVIGGALGLDPEVLHRANLIISLSKMTFPHEMCPLILFEQLYRAFSILRGEKYHK